MKTATKPLAIVFDEHLEAKPWKRRPPIMVHQVPLELIIEAERQQRQREEERRIHLELPVPERRPSYREPPRERSGVEIIELYDESDEEQDRGVTIINIFGDDD